MRILNLQSENFMRLVAIDITPTGNVVTITGKNANGKTSVLNSIWVALAGLSVSPKRPIRDGQKSAKVKISLGTNGKPDLIVERRFTEDGSTLSIYNADGAKFPSPQTMLDKLLGQLSFDPLSFARMESKEQFDELRRVTKLEVDIDALNEANQRDYETRTSVNRDAKAKRTQAAAIIVAPNLPKDPLDVSGLIDGLTKAGAENANIENRKANRAVAAQQIIAMKADGDRDIEHAIELEEQAKRVRSLAADKYAKANLMQKDLDTAEELPAPKDLTKLRSDLEGARATNQRIAARDRRREIETEAEKLEDRSKALSAQMEQREQTKRDAIASAAMPVVGLGFGDGEVTYKGVPFSQVSDSEKLHVSLGIAMAANPKLRVIRIQDGSLLDGDGLAQIGKLAMENDYQVWLERVDSTGKVGIVIEDGNVVAINEDAESREV